MASRIEVLIEKFRMALNMGERVPEIKRQIEDISEKLEAMAISQKNVDEKMVVDFCNPSKGHRGKKRSADEEPLLLPRNNRRKLAH